MYPPFLTRFKIYRRIIGGEWYKTKYMGWIKSETFDNYIRTGINPVLIKWECYDDQKS